MITSLTDRALLWFDAWFSSKAGVYQTLLVTLAIVIAEQLWPAFDPHGFAVLYLLTVYSAVTQPALANTGRQSADRIEQILTAMEALLEREDLELHQLMRFAHGDEA